MVGEGDFPRLWLGSAAHQRRAGSRVVRLAKRTLRPMAQRHAAGHRLDGCDLQGLAFGQWRQQPWQTARQQGLAGARWAAEQQVVGQYTKSIEAPVSPGQRARQPI